MAKFTYRATEFNRVNWEKLAEQAQGERVVVAIDVGKVDMFANLMMPDRSILATVKWSHPQESAAVVK